MADSCCCLAESTQHCKAIVLQLKNVKKKKQLNWCFSTPELAKKKNMTTPSISEDVEQWELY